MTELQWLIKMLTKEKLPNSLKDLFIERIGEVEASLSRPAPQIPRPTITGQAPSTQRLLEQMAYDTGAPVPVPVVAQTVQAAAALESRQAAIKQAASGKPEPGRTSPRKF